MVERWLQVAGFPTYEISDRGSLRRGTRQIKQTLTSNGYVKYGMTDACGVRHTKSAHRLVAEAFIGPPPFVGAMVRHLDDQKSKNNVDNLRWGTAKENWADAHRNGRIPLGDNHPTHLKPWTRRRGERGPRSKLNSEQVIDIFAAEGKQRDIAAKYGVNQALVWRIKKRLAWRHITDPEYAAFLRAHSGNDEIAEQIIKQARKAPAFFQESEQ